MVAFAENPVNIFLSNFKGRNLMKKNQELSEKKSFPFFSHDKKKHIILVFLLVLYNFTACSEQKVEQNIFSQCLLLFLKHKHCSIKLKLH